MPTDPKTGERLPNPGEPGAEAGAPQSPEMATKGAQGEDPIRDATELIADIDREIAEREGKEAPQGEGEMKAEGGAEDLKPLEETLGITPDRAKMLFDAAQELAKTQGKSPQELADMIAKDFEVLMQLEMVAARGKDDQPEEAQAMPEQPAEMMPGAEPAMTPQGGM
jgi:hypothetical protein